MESGAHVLAIEILVPLALVVPLLAHGIIIALVGVINGSMVQGGAEGVGKVTTRSVVISITLIVVADMIFAYMTTQ